MVDKAFGKRPPDHSKPALKFSAVEEAVTPTYPPVFDSIAGWGGWQILWNDSWGDCVVVSWSTARRIATRIFNVEQYVTDRDSILELYRTQNPNFDPDDPNHGPGSDDDGGMYIQQFLGYLNKTGGTDGVKAIAFAKVDHTDLAEMKAALSIFNFLWIGCEVNTQNTAAFDRHDSWDWKTDYRVLGGHSIIGTGYDQNKFNMQTWADEGFLNSAFVRNAIDEAWVVIWPEHAAKLTEQQRSDLNAKYYALTNRNIDWTSVPPFTPDPVPTPVADPDQKLAGAIRQFLARKPKFYRKTIQKQLQTWLTEKGL